MARGRMISKSLSTSEKFAGLHDSAGKLAEFCQSLYPLLVAHADDWGCQQGDVFTIKHLVHPTSPRRLGEFEAALMHLHNARLITWYEDESGKRVVYVTGFSSHQDLKGHDKSRSRKFSTPPENPPVFAIGGKTPPKFPNGDATEEKRREEKGTYTVGASEPAPVEGEDENGEGESKPEVGAFIRRFCDLYSKHRHGARYFVKRQQHVPLIRALLRVYDFERLSDMAVVLLTTDEDWITATDRGIGILSTKAAWLDGLLAEHKAKRGRGAA